MQLEKVLGRHIICEFTNCEYDTINDPEKLKNIFIEGSLQANAGVLGHLEHRFTPQGVTVLVLLSESHVSGHSYPELGYIAIDIFTCGNHVNTYQIFEYIHKNIGGRVKIKELDRGIPFSDDTIGLPKALE